MSKKEEYRILITAAGSKGVPGIIRDLKSTGQKFYIVTADIDPEAIGNFFADKWYVVPPWSNDKYIESIIKIIKKEKLEYIIPNDNHIGLMKLCDLSSHIKDRLRIAISKNREHLSIALNKFKLFDFLHSTEMKDYIPKYSVATDKKSLLNNIVKLGYPKEMVAIKPSIAEGSRGLKIIGKDKRNIFDERGDNKFLSYEELLFHLESVQKIPKVLVMEYLPGDEYSVDVLVNRNRKIEYMIPRIRRQVSEGVSIKGVVKKNPEIEKIVINLLKKLDLIYALNIQIKYSKKGIPKIIELNPRVSGSMTFCTGAGVNLHYYLVLLLAGKPLPRVKIKYGTRIYRYYEEKYLFKN